MNAPVSPPSLPPFNYSPLFPLAKDTTPYRKLTAEGVRVETREAGPLEEEPEKGAHAGHVMAAYERWLGEGPERAILRMVGLFDRPAEGDAIRALLAEPAIAGLTETLTGLP